MPRGSLAASATPAAAQYYGYHSYPYNNYYYHHHHGGDSTGAALAGGILGFALGAAVGSSSNHGYYRNGYYDRGYYGGGYYDRGYYGSRYYSPYYGDDYYGGYRVCTTRRTIWDPYIGAYIVPGAFNGDFSMPSNALLVRSNRVSRLDFWAAMTCSAVSIGILLWGRLGFGHSCCTAA